MTKPKGMTAAQLSAFQRQPIMSRILRDGPTREQVLERLRYEPDTGHFYRVKNNAHCPPRAGTTSPDGYRRISFDERRYLEHRLAWLVMTGEWPSIFIDHRNRNRGDNRWDNLRLADKSQQAFNSKIFTSNKSGFRGVYWYKARKKWVSRIIIFGKQKWLGTFDTREAAADAYLREVANSSNAAFLGEVSR